MTSVEANFSAVGGAIASIRPATGNNVAYLQISAPNSDAPRQRVPDPQVRQDAARLLEGEAVALVPVREVSVPLDSACDPAVPAERHRASSSFS
jgi:hypothetical protein